MSHVLPGPEKRHFIFDIWSKVLFFTFLTKTSDNSITLLLGPRSRGCWGELCPFSYIRLHTCPRPHTTSVQAEIFLLVPFFFFVILFQCRGDIKKVCRRFHIQHINVQGQHTFTCVPSPYLPCNKHSIHPKPQNLFIEIYWCSCRLFGAAVWSTGWGYR